MKILNIQITNFGIDHSDLENTYDDIAVIYFLKKMEQKGVEYLSKSLDIKIKNSGSSNLEVARKYEMIGNINYQNKQYRQALKFYRNSLAIFDNVLPENDSEAVLIHFWIGNCYLMIGDWKNAIIYLTKGMKIQKRKYGNDDPYVKKIMNRIDTAIKNEKLHNRHLDEVLLI